MYPANCIFNNANSTYNKCALQTAGVTFWPKTSSFADFCQIDSDYSGPFLMNFQANCDPYNVVNNTVASSGMIVVDGGASKVNFTNCVFANNTMASVVTLGTAGGGGSVPSFISCVFDFALSSHGACIISDCVTNAAPITNSISLFFESGCNVMRDFSQPIAGIAFL